MAKNHGKLTKFLIHNTGNLRNVDKVKVHRTINAFLSSSRPRLTGPGYSTVRQWLRTKSFQEQFEFGLQIFEEVLAGKKL